MSTLNASATISSSKNTDLTASYGILHPEIKVSASSLPAGWANLTSNDSAHLAKPATQPNLNSWAEGVLSGMAKIGAWYDDVSRRLAHTSADESFSTLQSLPQTKDGIHQLGLKSSDASRATSAEFAPSKLGKGISLFGSIVEATTGVLSTLSALNQDRLKGDSSYSGTLMAALKATGQSALSAGMGVGVGAVVAAGTGTVMLPVILGAGAAIGAGYAFGKVMDYMRS